MYERSINGYIVDKVLSNFPDISPDWLIFGTGDMYRVSEADSMPPIDSDIEIISDEDVFEEDLEQGDSLDNRYDNSGIPADKPYVTNVNTSVDEIVTEDDTKDVFTNVNTSFVQNIVSLESEKTIESITVFYTDSTFKIYKQIK